MVDKKKSKRSKSSKKARPKRPSSERTSGPNKSLSKKPKSNSVDEYLLQLRFDPSRDLYVGSVLEIEDLVVEGENRDDVMQGLREALEDYCIDREHEGSGVPVPFYARSYPEELVLNLSSGLFRKLEMRSRREKIDLETLAIELLSESLNRRGQETRPLRHVQNNNGPAKRNHNNHGNHNHNHGNNSGRRNNRGGRDKKRGFDYHGTMDSRENFMDYIRKLEKGQRK